jgi:hypothetical protein
MWGYADSCTAAHQPFATSALERFQSARITSVVGLARKVRYQRARTPPSVAAMRGSPRSAARCWRQCRESAPAGRPAGRNRPAATNAHAGEAPPHRPGCTSEVATGWSSPPGRRRSPTPPAGTTRRRTRQWNSPVSGNADARRHTMWATAHRAPARTKSAATKRSHRPACVSVGGRGGGLADTLARRSYGNGEAGRDLDIRVGAVFVRAHRPLSKLDRIRIRDARGRS